MRPRGVRGGERYPCSGAGMGLMGTIADGVGEVRRPVQCVPVVFGTDLLCHMQGSQKVHSRCVLQRCGPQSATITAARPMRQEGQVGQLVPGVWADLPVVDGDPTQDMAPLAKPKPVSAC